MYSKERERYYNRIGWGIVAINEYMRQGIRNDRQLEGELRTRDIEEQRQVEENKIEEAKYNKRHGKWKEV